MRIKTITSLLYCLLTSMAFGQVCDCNISGSTTSDGFFYINSKPDVHPTSQLRFAKWQNNGNAHIDVMDGSHLFLNYYKGGDVHFGKGANTNGNPTGGESHSIFKKDGRLGVNTLSLNSGLNLQVLGAGQFGEQNGHSGIGGAAGARLGIRHSVTDDYAPMLLMVHSGIRTWDMGVHYDRSFRIRDFDANSYRLTILQNGNIGIGTTTPTEKLSVNGTIRSKEVKVEANNWPDYVFSSEYALPSLKETETYIQENHRLPNMPSAEEVAENGVALGEMNRLVVEKLEELTLHIIKLEKENRILKTELSQRPTANSQLSPEVKELMLQIKQLENRLTQLENDK